MGKQHCAYPSDSLNKMPHYIQGISQRIGAEENPGKTDQVEGEYRLPNLEQPGLFYPQDLVDLLLPGFVINRTCQVDPMQPSPDNKAPAGAVPDTGDQERDQ